MLVELTEQEHMIPLMVMRLKSQYLLKKKRKLVPSWIMKEREESMKDIDMGENNGGRGEFDDNIVMIT